MNQELTCLVPDYRPHTHFSKDCSDSFFDKLIPLNILINQICGSKALTFHNSVKSFNLQHAAVSVSQSQS